MISALPILTVNLLAQIDYVALMTAALGAFTLLYRFLWRGRWRHRVVWITCLLAALLLGAGWFFVDAAGKRDERRIRGLMEGLAPAFAEKMAQMGHARISAESSPDDPHYLKLIIAQTRWMAANRLVQNIQTLRRLPDGRRAWIVDSKRDRENDGRIHTEAETRTRTGEVLGEESAWLESVFNGTTLFDAKPVADRRGTWVRGAAPLFDEKKRVEAVVVVEFAAADLLGARRHGRWTAIGFLAAALFIVAAVNAVASQVFSARDRVDRRTLAARERESLKRELKAMQLQQKKLEALVNSIDGIVWEAEAESSRFTFVSRQSEPILGFTPKQCMADKAFWGGRLHPEDGWAVDHRKKMVARKRHYSFDYRMMAADGRTVWIRESAAAVTGRNQEPALVHGAFLDITKQRRAAEELDEAHRALVECSRNAVMAEVATGVLHNVGNVLNSVNTSGALIRDKVGASKVAELTKISALLDEHHDRFADFIASDPRGKFVPKLISRVAEALRAEQVQVQAEVDTITRNIAHIKDIVFLQQMDSKVASVLEPTDVAGLVEHALQINAGSLSGQEVKIVREFQEVPPAFVEKHKVLQILVNLIRNAEQAVDEAPDELPKTVILRIENPCGSDRVRVIVQDNGVGIASTDLDRIFSHGFTTKKSGHGFGLHSGALAAKEMGGALRAESAGLSQGATFTLELPLEPPVQAIDASSTAEAA